MQRTDALYKKLLDQPNHWFETKVVVDGTEYFEDHLYSVSTSIQAFESNPKVGRAVAQEVNCVLINPDRDFPRMAKIEVYIRAVGTVVEGTQASFSGDTVILNGFCSFSGDAVAFDSDSGVIFSADTVSISNSSGNESSEWLPQGVFYTDTKEFSDNGSGIVKCTLHGYDAMLKGETKYDSTALNWPAVDTAVLNEIAGKMGLTVDQRTYEVMTDGYMIPLPTNYYLREVLEILAAKYIGVFVITDDGKLILQSLLGLPQETNLLITNTGNYITFGGVRIIING